MWNSEGSDEIFWSDSAKMLLVGLIKKYPDSTKDIRGDEKDLKNMRREAWDLIFNELLDYGMPTSALDKVKSIWGEMKIEAMDAQTKWKRNKKTNKMTKVQKAVMDVIDFVNKESQPLMPMPIKIKPEPMDEDDTVNLQNRRTTRTLRARKSTGASSSKNTRVDRDDEKNSMVNATAGMSTKNSISPSEVANVSNTDSPILSPIVLLNRIPIKRQFDGQKINEESANYWNIMAKHETERMAFERELHRKNIELVDLKLRIEKEKLKAMTPKLLE